MSIQNANENNISQQKSARGEISYEEIKEQPIVTVDVSRSSKGQETDKSLPQVLEEEVNSSAFLFEPERPAMTATVGSNQNIVNFDQKSGGTLSNYNSSQSGVTPMGLVTDMGALTLNQ